VKAKKKEYIQFNTNGSVIGYGELVNYRIKDSITINLSNADSSTYQNYFYRIKQDTLIMSPREPLICIEGCSTYYVKSN
jgi:hypothetical protein